MPTFWRWASKIWDDDAYLCFRRAFCNSEGQTDVPRQSVWKQCLSEWSHQPLHFLALRPRNSLLCVLLLKKCNIEFQKRMKCRKEEKSQHLQVQHKSVFAIQFFFFFANKSSSVALLKSTCAHEKLKGKKSPHHFKKVFAKPALHERESLPSISGHNTSREKKKNAVKYKSLVSQTFIFS